MSQRTANRPTRKTHHARGSRHWNNKLKERDVKEIRILTKRGVRNKTLAKIFGVSPCTVSQISTGHSWGHIR